MVVVGEAAVIVSVVGWFVSPNIAMLMKIAQACATNKYKLSRDIKDKLNNLAADLERIKESLDPASTGFVNDPASLDRLWRLKDGIHDAEEILDLFQLEILEAEAFNKRNKKKRHAGKKKHTDSSLIGARKGSLDQLVIVLDNLQDTARKLHQDLHSLHGISPISSRPATAPYPVRDKKFLFGYDKEYDQLLACMLPDGNMHMGKAKVVIAIVGHGGMGKTELARQAYRDVEGKFDLRIWVHAYDKLTEFDLLKEIWKSAAGDRPVGDMNLPCLQKELEELLAPQRCLLVLDDVWNHERATSEVERKQARVALDLFMSFVRDGSRVVITTRAKICSTTLGAGASIVLNGIEPKQVLALLLSHTAELLAAGAAGIQEMLDKQVPKLKGSPLAAIDIGDEMRASRGTKQCCDILRDIERHMGSVFSGHLFTYQHLPPHLQRCFAFCSIFPFGWRFEPEKLVRMWIAHGFVEDTHLPPAGKIMEDVARGYFHDLVQRSLFQRETSSRDEGDKQSRYVIHEHIHWMIRRATVKHCISISRTSVPTSIPTTVRHLSVTGSCLDYLKEYSTGLSNLRTLLVVNDDDGDDPAASSTPLITSIDEGTLEKFTGVRVVDFTETCISQLPESIGKLTHVRYLGLPCTITDLCRPVSRLVFLQTLSVIDKKTNKKGKVRLPDDINRLINMRHLDIDMDCITNISGIGRMIKLQGSIQFEAIKGSEMSGHSVSELAGMNSLSGTLSIKGLDAVASKEEAMESCLAKKTSVRVLKLEWRALDLRRVIREPATVFAAAEVLEGLQPQRDLHHLRIARYPAATWPSWLGVLEKLTCLYLWNCRKMQALPALGRLPCLELLDVKELTSVERIDHDFCGGGAFPELKKIILDDMPKLVAWGEMPKQAFSRLREVSIFHCPLLSSLSGLECCGGPLCLIVKGCPAIAPATLPSNFSAGSSTSKFE